MPAINTIRELVRRYEANYPETLKTCYVVNASRVFQMLYSIVKPMLTARTLSKLQVFGSNEEQWKAVLLEKIPASELSVHFGGSYLAGPAGVGKPKVPETVPEENENDI